MKFWKIILPATFAAGALAGVTGKDLYDGWTAKGPLQLGDHFNAAVTDVYDGDTMTLHSGNQTYKGRIWGIDAPERSQRCTKAGKTVTCGLQARDAFRKLVLHKTVACEVKGFDNNHDRPVVRCLVGGKDPVSTIVRQGWAFSDTKYSDNPYGAEQKQARDGHKGIWGMEVLRPARWRACKSLGRGGPGSVPADCLKPLGPLKP